jgi:monoamine oxidase
VTVPLGVLKANTIKFQPKLPLHAEDFIEKMGFGLMNKVIFEFEECFWKNTPLD